MFSFISPRPSLTGSTTLCLESTILKHYQHLILLDAPATFWSRSVVSVGRFTARMFTLIIANDAVPVGEVKERNEATQTHDGDLCHAVGQGRDG